MGALVVRRPSAVDGAVVDGTLLADGGKPRETTHWDRLPDFVEVTQKFGKFSFENIIKGILAKAGAGARWVKCVCQAFRKAIR